MVFRPLTFGRDHRERLVADDDGRRYHAGRSVQLLRLGSSHPLTSRLATCYPLARGCSRHRSGRGPRVCGACALCGVRAGRPGRALRRRDRPSRQHVRPSAGAKRARRPSDRDRLRDGDRQPAAASAGSNRGRRIRSAAISRARPPGDRAAGPGPRRRRDGAVARIGARRDRRADRRDDSAVHRHQPAAIAVPGADGRPRAVALPIARQRIGHVPDVRRRDRVPDAGTDAGDAHGLPDRRRHRPGHRRGGGRLDSRAATVGTRGPARRRSSRSRTRRVLRCAAMSRDAGHLPRLAPAAAHVSDVHDVVCPARHRALRRPSRGRDGRVHGLGRRRRRRRPARRDHWRAHRPPQHDAPGVCADGHEPGPL